MTSSDRREMITAPVDLGTAELVPDPRSVTAWALFVDGVAQSYVDLADPLYVEFAYMRRVVTAVDAVQPRHKAIDVLHLGGGGLSLARYVAATRPGSHQVVIERDAALYAFVRERLPLPEDADITVSITGARAAMAAARAGAYDLIVSDVFEAARMPAEVATVEFAALVAPALRPTGLYVVNATDMPALSFTKRLAATLRTAFADVCVIADAGMLRGRRFGNCLLVASRRPDGLPVRALIGTRDGDAGPVGVLRNAALDTFMAGASPLRDRTVGATTTDVHTTRQRPARSDADAEAMTDERRTGREGRSHT